MRVFFLLDGRAAILGGVDVTAGADALATQMEGFDVVVVATGFVPGNPFKMNAAAHEVDNVGVCSVADAAKKAGAKRVVLISSILVNGSMKRVWDVVAEAAAAGERERERGPTLKAPPVVDANEEEEEGKSEG